MQWQKARIKKDKLKDIKSKLQTLEESVACSQMDKEKWNNIAKCNTKLKIIEMEQARNTDQITNQIYRRREITITRIKNQEVNTIIKIRK